MHHPAGARAASGKHSRSKKNTKVRGQKEIDAQRTNQIQTALIREHYLSGEPSGAWDSATQEALRKYQAAHGWQDKSVPDSRALIQLGLGPNHDRLLNPESAMTSGKIQSPAPSQLEAGPTQNKTNP